MNNDLISREALKKILEELAKDKFDSLYGDGIRRAIKEIDNAPTVSSLLNLDDITEEDIEKYKIILQRANSKGLRAIIEDRPQGEWLKSINEFFNWECSLCHDPHDFKDNYCPNCGAKMKDGKVHD